ncbi:MAG: host attachment protein [Nitrososphaeraceae archaeon]
MKLENTIVIIADLGELKAFEVQENEGIVGNDIKISHSLEMINNENFIEGRRKMSELMSDNMGRMIHDTLEEHNAIEEIENRTLKDIAQNIEVIVNQIKPKQVLLAFPKEHNHQLFNMLDKNVQSLIAKNLPLDLVKTDKNKILSHFID